MYMIRQLSFIFCLLSLAACSSHADQAAGIQQLVDRWPSLTNDLLILNKEAEAEQGRVQLALNNMVIPATATPTAEEREAAKYSKQRVQEKLTDFIKIRQVTGATINILQARQKHVFQLRDGLAQNDLPAQTPTLVAELQQIAADAEAALQQYRGQYTAAKTTYTDTFNAFMDMINPS